MATAERIFSIPIYKSEKEGIKGKIQTNLDSIQRIIDNIVEYPGSIKGSNGYWVLTEWLEHRVKLILKDQIKK